MLVDSNWMGHYIGNGIWRIETPRAPQVAGACLVQTTNVQLCLSHIGHVIGHAESTSAAIFAEINIINQTLYTDTSQTPLPLPLPIPARQARWCMTFVLVYVIVCHHHVVINNDDKNGPTIQSRGQPQKNHMPLSLNQLIHQFSHVILDLRTATKALYKTTAEYATAGAGTPDRPTRELCPRLCNCVPASCGNKSPL